MKLLRYYIRSGEINEVVVTYENEQFYISCEAYRKKIGLLKAIYSGPCFQPDKVVRRALSRWHEKDYNIVTNFARAFPRWCRTGNGGLTAINQIKLNEGKEVIQDIQVLNKGDHIMFDRGSYFHHAIVLGVSPLENQIRLIHFTSDDAKGKKIQIKQKVITRHEECGALFRLIYRKATENEADQVVSRAILIEEKDISYNLLNGNCEHLATWCKTGIWNSGQVKNLADYMLRQLLTVSITVNVHVISKFIEGLCKTDIRWLAPTKVDLIGCLTSCIIDIIWNIYDFIKKYKQGKLQGEALQTEIIKRVVGCLVVDSSMVLGSFLGLLVIPIPILGPLIGGQCGLALGHLINFIIQKIAAILKSENAKKLWQSSMKKLQNKPSELRKMLKEFPCISDCGLSCIGVVEV